MAPPIGAWRQYPRNTNFQPSSANAKRLNAGFGGSPLKTGIDLLGRNKRMKADRIRRPRSGLQLSFNKLQKGIRGVNAAVGGLALAGGLGGLLGGLLGKKKKKKKQEGSGQSTWRVARHQPWLLSLRQPDTWREQVVQANNEELRALTDVIRNLYDNVIKVPTDVKLPLRAHIREVRRLSGLTTPLHERRALLLRLGGERLIPFVQAGLHALKA